MNDKEDLERILERVTGKPAPPGLRERVLDGAAREARARQIMTPLLRAALAGCCLMLVFFALADQRISRMQEQRLDSYLLLTPTGALSPQKVIDEKMGEFLADLPDIDQASAQRLRQALLAQERAARAARPDIRLEEESYEN